MERIGYTSDSSDHRLAQGDRRTPMERRAFLAASTAAGITSQGAASPAPLVLELRRYRLRNGPMAARFGAYAKDALVPALGRAGIAPVGAWNMSFGPESPTLHLLLPHPDAA